MQTRQIRVQIYHSGGKCIGILGIIAAMPRCFCKTNDRAGGH